MPKSENLSDLEADVTLAKRATDEARLRLHRVDELGARIAALTASVRVTAQLVGLPKDTE